MIFYIHFPLLSKPNILVQDVFSGATIYFSIVSTNQSFYLSLYLSIYILVPEEIFTQDSSEPTSFDSYGGAQGSGVTPGISRVVDVKVQVSTILT